MHCMYHIYCTGGVKGQAKPFLLNLQRVPTPVRANVSQSAPLARPLLAGFVGAGCVSSCVSGPQDLRLIRQGLGLGGNKEGI